MNIFVLDSNPAKAAEYHCDKHVLKMLLESAQMLSTMVHVLTPHEIEIVNSVETGEPVCMWRGVKVYKPTHQNHPCAVWLRSGTKNVQWLLELCHGLNHQSEIRWHKPAYKAHAIVKGIETNFMWTEGRLMSQNLALQPFVLAMPANIIELNLDPVTSYRLYYASAKRSFATWNRLGKKPYWWGDMCHHANTLGLNKAEIKESA